MSEPSFAWIFQANPKRFDIGAFVASAPDQCEWLVSRYAAQMGPGQRVFLWCAAGDPVLPSGVFAEAVTVTGVRDIADDGPFRFWTDPAEGRQAKPRVRIALRRVAGKKEVIKRDWWKGDPALADHLLLSMANHTTFKIEGDAYRRLDRLWARTGSDWDYEEALGGLYAFVETLDQPVSKLPGSVVANVSMTIGRPVTGVYNKVMNFRALDPSDPRKGFDGASDQDKAVWSAFHDAATGLRSEAVRAEYARLWANRAEDRGVASPSRQAGATPVPPTAARRMSADLFETEFAWFKSEIERVSGSPFRSFQEGLVAQWEGYKPLVREEALKRLGAADWEEPLVGAGVILEQAISAIEISGPGDLKNNLVGWQNQYGHGSRSHRALLDARGNQASTLVVERLLFDVFKVGLSEAEAFERMTAAGIRSYDLTAYLFFLLDGDRYMPIRPMTFDPVLRRLGFEFSTTSKCSVENYGRYNDALREVQAALTRVTELEDLRLIDAHSFCWVLGRIDQTQPSRPPRKKAGPAVVVYDARRRSIYMMVANALAAARAGNGQIVERTMKNKEVRMSQQELEAYIDALIEKNDGRCALTGLTLQFQGEHDDDQLLASLDRINSDGHYEVGNLQVVCRFANRWKSDSHTDEFVRLLTLVRHAG